MTSFIAIKLPENITIISFIEKHSKTKHKFIGNSNLIHSLIVIRSLSLSSAFAARSGGAGKTMRISGNLSAFELVQMIEVKHRGPTVVAADIFID